MNKSLKITWVRVRWLVSFTPTLLLQCQCSGTSKMFTLMSSEYIGFKAEYLGDFSVNHGVKSEEKYAVPKDRQKITNMYLLNTFPCSSVPPLSARLSVPGSVSSSGSKSGVSLTAGSWYNVSCSATGSSPFVFYNWSLGPGPAERDKQVTLSILSRGWIMDEIFGQITWLIYARALMTDAMTITVQHPVLILTLTFSRLVTVLW